MTLPPTESLTVEFKSDRKRFSDHDLVLAVVCLANTEGGEIWLGVEDDGTPTGLHPEHMDILGLAGMVASRTVPPVSVRAEAVRISEVTVARIEVPRSERLVASSAGTLQRRRLRFDGRPECVPFLPHEFVTRQSDLRLVDFSALPVANASVHEFDPLERVRLRQAIDRYHGDQALKDLSDEELDGALGFVSRQGDRRVPTVTGLLFLGKEAAIREHIPTHEAAFQWLEGTEVRVNDFYRWPLIRAFERIEEQFAARLVEQELQVGLFRVAVPTLDRSAFREALVNALSHRDYTRLGAVHVRFEMKPGEGGTLGRGGQLVVSNPGGFVDGVSQENILVTEPRPRNPTLADAFKRIGLAEKTGRGVDLIYKGLLRYGRPSPDWSGTTPSTVAVRLDCGEADLAFLRLVIEEEQRGRAPMPIDTLIVLSRLRTARRLDIAELGAAIQKSPVAARTVVERMVEAGMVVAHGVKKGRTYTLSADLYRRMGQQAGYIRQAGFDRLQQEQMIRAYVREHGSIRRREVVELCRLGEHQATRLLRKLVEAGILEKKGERKATVYERGPNI